MEAQGGTRVQKARSACDVCHKPIVRFAMNSVLFTVAEEGMAVRGAGRESPQGHRDPCSSTRSWEQRDRCRPCSGLWRRSAAAHRGSRPVPLPAVRTGERGWARVEAERSPPARPCRREPAAQAPAPDARNPPVCRPCGAAWALPERLIQLPGVRPGLQRVFVEQPSPVRAKQAEAVAARAPGPAAAMGAPPVPPGHPRPSHARCTRRQRVW